MARTESVSWQSTANRGSGLTPEQCVGSNFFKTEFAPNPNLEVSAAVSMQRLSRWMSCEVVMYSGSRIYG